MFLSTIVSAIEAMAITHDERRNVGLPRSHNLTGMDSAV
jgi:hypothetical protein